MIREKEIVRQLWYALVDKNYSVKKKQTTDFEMMTSVAFLIHGCDWLFKFQSLGVNSNYKCIKISFNIQ